MSLRPFAIPFAAVILMGLLPVSSVHAAVGLHLTDSCGKTMDGTTNSTVSVNSMNGDITINPYSPAASAPYVAGIGSCELAAADAKPRCTLSASITLAEVNTPVSLFAKCQATGSTIPNYVWTSPVGGPALPANAGTSNSVTLTFPTAGAYTYTVAGINASSTTGPSSTPVTILVGNSTATPVVPTCIATISPVQITQGQSATGNVVCNPAASSFEWVAPTNAPPLTSGANGSTGAVQFAVAGEFVYKAYGKNAAGTRGPVSAAGINVVSNSTCTPVAPSVDLTLPQYSLSQDILSWVGHVTAFSFQLAPGASTSPNFYMHSQYTTYVVPEGALWVVSACKGDTSGMGVCTQALGGQYSQMTVSTTGNPAAQCVIQPNVTYYLNVKTTGCAAGYCGYRMQRGN